MSQQINTINNHYIQAATAIADENGNSITSTYATKADAPLFVGYYNITTQDEMDAAYNAGREVILKYVNENETIWFTLTKVAVQDGNTYHFTSGPMMDSSYYTTYLYDDVWSTVLKNEGKDVFYGNYNTAPYLVVNACNSGKAVFFTDNNGKIYTQTSNSKFIHVNDDFSIDIVICDIEGYHTTHYNLPLISYSEGDGIYINENTNTISVKRDGKSIKSNSYGLYISTQDSSPVYIRNDNGNIDIWPEYQYPSRNNAATLTSKVGSSNACGDVFKLNTNLQLNHWYELELEVSIHACDNNGNYKDLSKSVSIVQFKAVNGLNSSFTVCCSDLSVYDNGSIEGVYIPYYTALMFGKITYLHNYSNTGSSALMINGSIFGNPRNTRYDNYSAYYMNTGNGSPYFFGIKEITIRGIRLKP